MTDHRGGHDHDPDPAALDELRRAFADEGDDADDAGDRGDAADDPDPAAAVTTARLDAVESGSPRVDAPSGEPDGPGGARAAGDGPGERGAPGEHGAPGEPGDPGEPGGPGVARAGVEPDDVGDASPAILSAELPDVDRPDGPFDVVIVEQEPMPADEPPPPRIIRIDDYSGSTELPPESSPGTAPAAGANPDDPSRVAVPGEPMSAMTAADVPSADPAATPPSGDDAVPGVISISDDELPDAVYVEGSLDRDGSGTIVIIEDDDTGDTLAPESERDLRRGIEPRMRERRVAVKRAQGRRRLKRVGIVVAVVLLVVAVLAVFGSPLFAVRADDVRVFNAVYTDPDELQEIIDDVVGTPVLRVDTTAVEDRIEQIPWVERASVRTDFPHGLVVEIREREAISTYQGPDERFRVLDRDGRVLDVLDLYPYAYVLIGGPDSVDLSPGEFAPQGYAAASELAKNLTATVRGRVTFIEVNADGSRLVMTLDDGSTVFFGEARDLLAKLVRLEAVLANGQEREPGLIDVSTADVTR